ncbi:hypothetical protein E4U42_004208 [Claviceps africana]|uniref:Uncharacterized protein n=1 Tax=Claviceps africana TaxID=83212 RepID=A0A8K0J5C6_9HYPO|nr:hypothetical protein E4U42_004208 [Claviceps africana]
MRSYKISFAVLSGVAGGLALQNAIVFSKASCQGQQQAFEPNGMCMLLNEELRGKAKGAKVPMDVVCDFYSDESCSAPLWIGMEEPGTCSFDDLEIENKAVSILCYDDSRPNEV